MAHFPLHLFITLWIKWILDGKIDNFSLWVIDGAFDINSVALLFGWSESAIDSGSNVGWDEDISLVKFIALLLDSNIKDGVLNALGELVTFWIND